MVLMEKSYFGVLWMEDDTVLSKKPLRLIIAEAGKEVLREEVQLRVSQSSFCWVVCWLFLSLFFLVKSVH